MSEADTVARHRPQARLPARLRLAGRLPRRPLPPHRRQCRRAGRQPPRRPGAAGHSRRWRSRRSSPPPAIASRPPTAPGPRACAAATSTRSPPRSARAPSGAATARSIRRRSSTRSARWPIPTTSPSPTAATCSASPVSAWRPAPISTPAPSAASASVCPMPWRRRSPFPDRQVICVTGDGAFGINAMEIDTTVRHGAKAVLIVSNNAAWNIERYDQQYNYGGRVSAPTLAHSDYAAMARALGAPWRARRGPRRPGGRDSARAGQRPGADRRRHLPVRRLVGRAGRASASSPTTRR